MNGLCCGLLYLEMVLYLEIVAFKVSEIWFNSP